MDYKSCPDITKNQLTAELMDLLEQRHQFRQQLFAPTNESNPHLSRRAEKAMQAIDNRLQLIRRAMEILEVLESTNTKNS